jgi:23S rRNA (cytosine1962-C5)-methyltransferase
MKSTITLHQDKEKTVLRGHPWIFPKAISHASGALVTGELVKVLDAKGHYIAIGVYNEHSMYRVRVLLLASESSDDDSIDAIVQYRLHQAFKVRQALLLPNAKTNVFRLFNSESDGLSGLTIDCFNTVTVVSSTAYWVEAHKEVIIQAIKQITGRGDILWLQQEKSLAQDGWTHLTETVLPEKVVDVSEGGVVYRIDFASVQKTGLFIDQRENHERIAAFTAGKRVLDLYTYTGGFALHAAKAGAAHVTAVDSAKQAIEMAKENAVLNGVSQIDFVVDDSRNYLRKVGDYDVIILDPPKLVPSKRHREQAKNYYRFLHRETFKAMKEGSILMTCNCSAALPQSEFVSLVTAQAAPVGKQVRVLGIYGPACCHPVLPVFPEGNYLTAVLLAVV